MINRKIHIGIFGKKDDPKPPEKPAEKTSNSMFSGMMMKKSTKPETPSSGYVPPVAEFLPSKPYEVPSQKIPESETLYKASTKSSQDTQESFDTVKGTLDPFADLVLNESKQVKKPSNESKPEEKPIKPSIPSEKPEEKSKKPKIPGFDDDDEEESLQFVRKSKLNLNPNEVPRPANINKVEETKVEVKKFEETKVEVKKEEIKQEDENKGKSENRILRMLEEKKRKDAEEKERKEREKLEESVRLEQIRLRVEEEMKKKEVEETRRAEEEKRKLISSINPVLFQEDIEENMKKFDLEVQDKVKKQAGLKEENKQLIDKVQNFQAKVTELETQEDQAAYQEDFEEAARIHEELETMRESIKALHNSIQENSSVYSSLESQKSLLIENKKQWILSTHSSRQDLLNQLSSTLESNKSKAELKIKTEQETLSAQIEKKVEKKEELLSLQASVTERKVELEQRIYEKTEDLKQNHKSLSVEYAGILNEIKELEELLSSKKAKAKTLNEEVKNADLMLKKSLIEFEEEVKETEEAESMVSKDIEVVVNEKLALDDQEAKSKTEFEQFMQSYNEKIEENVQFQKLLDSLTEELNRMNSLNQKREQFLQEIQKTEDELSEKETILKEALDYHNSCKDEIIGLKDDIKLQEEKIKEIDKKIPVLENEKKLAAAAKQFKVTQN